MTVKTSAGSTIAISASQPATYNQAGYEALSYTSIGEVVNMGEFGRVYELVTHNALATRSTVKKKGSFNEGQMALQLGLDTDDAGQILAKSASLSDNDYSIRVTTQNGDDYYFQAVVMQFKVGVGGVNQITAAMINLELTTNTAGVGIVEVLA